MSMLEPGRVCTPRGQACCNPLSSLLPAVGEEAHLSPLGPVWSGQTLVGFIWDQEGLGPGQGWDKDLQVLVGS